MHVITTEYSLSGFWYNITIDVTVSFEQSAYSVDEDHGPVDLVLVLSTPSSFGINLQIITNDNTAIG